MNNTGNIVKMLAELDVSTRAARRKTTALLADALDRVRQAEEAYMERIPENLQGGSAYDDADCTAELLLEAVISLGSAFD